MTRGLFITGTDTGVGKTRIAQALLTALAATGLRAVGMKPVAAGFAGDELPEDVVALRAAGNVEAPSADVNPYAFRRAIAPHLAAAEERRDIEWPRIEAAYAALGARADVVIVEGAGGALVPLGERWDMLDIAARLRLPVLLVVGIRLGCINHALLTALAVRQRGLALAGFIANRLERDMPAADGNVRALAERIAAPLVADVPFSAALPTLSPDVLRALGLLD